MNRFTPLMLAFVIVAGGVVYVPSAVAQEETILEDFEDDEPFFEPEADWYNWFDTSGIQGDVRSNKALSGNQSLRFNAVTFDGDLGGDAGHDITTFDACDTTKIVFSLNFDPMPSNGFVVALSTEREARTWSGGTEVAGWLGVRISSTGVVEAIAKNANSAGPGASATMAGVNVQNNTWTEFTLFPDCGNASVQVVSTTLGETATADSGGSLSNLDHLIYTKAGLTDSTVSVNIDDVEVFGVDVPNPSFNAADSFTVPSGQIVGFDVDGAGQTVILRVTDGGSNFVRTLSGATLTGSSTSETNCNRVNGVASLGSHVSYLQCSATDSSDVTQMRIRSASLGDPSTGSSFCVNQCPKDINDEDLASSEDTLDHLDDVKSFPFTYEEGTTSGENTAFLSWAFSTDTGNLGVVTYAARNNAPDRSNVDSVSVAPSNNGLSNICSARGSDELDYIYGADAPSNMVAARADFTIQSGITAGGNDIEVDLSTLFSGHSLTSLPLGVGCGSDIFVVGTDSNVLTGWQRSGSTFNHLWTDTPGVTLTDRGVTMSQNGLFYAYVDDATDTGFVGHASNGSILAEFTYTLDVGEDFLALAMDNTAQNIWVASSTDVERFEIFTATTGDPQAPGEGGADPTVVTVGDGFSGDIKTSTANALGISEASAGAFATMIVMVMDASIFAVPVFLASRNAMLTMWTAYAGAVGGLIIAFAIGLAPGWVLTLLAVVLVATAILMVTLGVRR